VAGEIAPLGRDPGMGTLVKKPDTFQQPANGLSPSVTFTHDPLNNYKSSAYLPGRTLPRQALAVGAVVEGTLPGVPDAGQSSEVHDHLTRAAA